MSYKKSCNFRCPMILLVIVGFILTFNATAWAQAQPSVTSTNPVNGATNVMRDVFVSADVFVPNGGIDPATLTSSTVFLYRTSDLQSVPGVLNTSGGGDVIVLRPVSLLDANTSYTFQVTSGLKDITGVGFVPFTMSFTTGTGMGGTDTSVSFQKIALAAAPVKTYTSVLLGPDGKLYAGTVNGEILRFAINADGTLGAPQSIISLQTANGGNRLLIGLRFDPSSTAGNLILWASHSAFTFSNGPDWAGKITRLSGVDLETVVDYVVGLPRSTRDHVTNQIDFGPDGALYFTQGSSSAMGAPDSAWDFRTEKLLNAAVLRLDVAAVTTPPLDVKTAEGGTYDPFAPGVPLTIFGSGVRNAFDLCWHRNGNLYVPTNGSASGGNTPATPSPFTPPYTPRIDQSTNGPYNGPQVPALSAVSQTMNDYLFRVVQGGYYGHPNPTRNEYVLNGGNPTSGSDTAQVDAYPVGTLPDRNWRGAAFDFGQHYSPDGIIEYKSNVFGGALTGKLLVVRYSGGDDIIVLTPGLNGDIINSQTGIVGFTGFTDPLDITENPANGFLYVAEYGGQKLTLLKPIPPTVPAAPTNLTATAASSSQINLAWSDTANNETGFRIERKLGAGGTYAEIATPAANVTSYSDTGLTASTTYYYRVRAYNATGTSAYSNEANATTSATTPPPNGTGLRGQYYDNSNLTNLKLTRTDATVNFTWGTGAPATGIGADTFSVRWTGQVQARFSQTYTFYTTSDDGVRLWVNGVQIINNWTNHSSTENSGTIALVANQKYDILMEYYENTGSAVAKLSWSSASQAKQIIPQIQLYPAVTVPAAPSNLTATAVSSGQINLAWTDNANNETSFRIERSPNGSSFTEIATVGANVTSFSNTGLAASTTYFYRVRASNSGGNSAYSNTTSATTQSATSTLYEAENAVLVGAVVSNIHAGYTGTGFVDYINPSGDYIEWTVSAPAAGSYILDFRYGNGGTTNRPLELRVNGGVVNPSLAFPSTGTWTNWSLSSAPVSLTAGTNTIRLTAIGSSGANIDSLTVR
jgi:PA14 domain-containing protein/Big-like domain-containing protein/carbohydrate binding protein with CBM6 domain/fibronectin type III domain protein/strictosidine synthase-like protein